MKVFFTKISFFHKLLAVNLAVFALTLGANAFQFQSLVDSLKSRQREFLSYSAADAAESVAKHFREAYVAPQILAKNNSFQSGDLGRIQEALDKFAADHSNTDLSIFMNLDGEVLATNTKNANGTNLDTGKIIGKNVKKEEWFTKLLAKEFTEDSSKSLQGGVYSGPFFSELASAAYAEQRYTSVFASPVFNSSGSIVGAVANFENFNWADAEFSAFYKHWKEKHMPGIRFSVLDKKGNVLAVYSPSENGGSLTPKHDTSILQKKNFFEANRSLASTISAGQAGYSVFLAPDSNTKQAAGYHPVESAGFPGVLGWSILTTIDESALLGNLNTRVNNFWIVLFSTVCASLLLLFFVVNRARKQLGAFSQRIGDVVKKASGLADSLSGASGSLASSTQEQAAAIQESVSALSEMSSMISQTGQSVQHSLSSSKEATIEAVEGKKTIELLSGAILAIQKSNDQMQEISIIIGNIGEKTSVINDIVFKTQLLSFNASIEAARAGAHGRGFSVVAEEVSNLAELSGEAAKEIDVLLQESQSKVKDTLESIQVRVTDTVKTNRMVQQSFETISGYVEKMEQQLNSIGEASKQQELGIQQTNAAMRQMESSAEENRGASEKTHQASEELSRESNSLSALTDDLAFFVNGDSIRDHSTGKAMEKIVKDEVTTMDLGKLVSSISSMQEGQLGEPTKEVKNKDQFFKKAA